MSNSKLAYAAAPHAQSGLSLIELMVSLVILGIVLAIGVPRTADYINIKEAERTRMLLEQDLKYARDAAARLVARVELRPINNAWNTGWQVVRVNDDGSEEVLRLNGSIGAPISPSNGISSGQFNAGNPVAFDAQGRLINNTGNANLGEFRIQQQGCTNPAQFTISVNFIGQVVVTEAAC